MIGARELTLRAAEGDALHVAELLVGKRRKGAPPAKVDVSAPSDALIEAVARTISAACLRFLLEHGGGKERVVLREGRRRSGRLWDASLNADFDMRFSRAARAFWQQVAKDVMPIAHRARGTTATSAGAVTRSHRGIVKSLVPDGEGGVGDLVFFALAHENASALGLHPELEELLRHELRVNIPLPLLFSPDDPDVDERAVRGLLHTLLAPGPARVIECIDDALVNAWVARFRSVLIEAESRTSFLAHMRAFSRTLRAWLTLLDGAGRLDLARSVVRFLSVLTTRAIPRELNLRNHVLRLPPGGHSMAERDEALQAMLGVVNLRLFLDEAQTRLGQQRYGDERYDEAQVFVPMVDAELQGRDALDALARTLSGAVG